MILLWCLLVALCLRSYWLEVVAVGWAVWIFLRRKWFKAHARYPRLRFRVPTLIRPVLDAVLALDPVTHALDYGQTPLERVQIVRALLYRVPSDTVPPALSELSWDQTAAPEHRERELEAVRAAVDSMRPPEDLTERVTGAWAEAAGRGEEFVHLCQCREDCCFDCCGADADPHGCYLVVEYAGHSGSLEGAGGHEHFACVYAQGEGRWHFPPVPASEACSAGLSARHVDTAMCGEHDVTALLRKLCGPRRDFGVSTPFKLNTLKVAIAMQADGCRLEGVTIEDVFSEPLVW